MVGDAAHSGWDTRSHEDALISVAELADQADHLRTRLSVLPVADPVATLAELHRLRSLLDAAEAATAWSQP